jgi:hypothetical protein
LKRDTVNAARRGTHEPITSTHALISGRIRSVAEHGYLSKRETTRSRRSLLRMKEQPIVSALIEFIFVV